MILPVTAVIAATVLAGRVGSRGILSVAPIEAAVSAEEPSAADVAARTGRHRIAAVLALGGSALMVAGVIVGFASPGGVMIGLLGGILGFSGVIAGADRVMPLCLRTVGRLLGRSATARLAVANAARHPDRSARATIGMTIGVTLVTTLTVTLTTFERSLAATGRSTEGFASIILVFSVLVGFSAVIGAVGMVNSLSLSVEQRRRELGLLRTLGFTRRQVQRMILAESTQMAVTSVAFGLLLGTLFGWCGAQAALGSISKTLVLPALPPTFAAALALVALVLAAVAAIAPSRRATRVNPIEALRVA
jgi:putative ABC transport system permease protein